MSALIALGLALSLASAQEAPTVQDAPAAKAEDGSTSKNKGKKKGKAKESRETGGIGGSPVYTTGDLRWILMVPPDFVVNTDGVEVGQGPVLNQRLRTGLDLRMEDFTVKTEADILSGQVAGDPWDIPGMEDDRHREDIGVLDAGDAFVARRGSVQGRLGPVQIEAGLVLSHWGLGMVANDGAHDPVGFGYNEFGDRVLRFRVTTAPLGKKGDRTPLYFSLAGDRVVEDELANMDLGQEAWQGIASVLWADKEGRKLGVYGVYRHQIESDDTRVTKAGFYDAYGALPLAIGENTLLLEAEGALIRGNTSRASTYTSPEGLDVRAAGVAAQARMSMPKAKLDTILRAGWASGDGDPDDGVSNDFTFDRDFDVGMVMFDELGGAIEAGAYSQLTDPQYSYLPPEGVELVTNEGAVRRAAYVQPIVELRPKDWLLVKGGVLMAWQTAPIAQPFATFRAGGTPTNHLGQPTQGYSLGTELDWAVGFGDTEVTMGKLTARPQLLVQGGHLLASSDMGGGTHNLFLASGRVRW